ncbi:MAG: PEPxxWA-CTERM sorting domain-containing protein [Proteobacteria bacterium]|nr:PEPxxWA-CTERM sorting domain-containing protein [Pseudomonadota bacterium]
MKVFAAAAVLAGIAVAGGASAQNLITNGSFEAAGTTGHGAITSPWTYSATFGTDTSHPATIIQYNSTNGYDSGAFGEPIPTAPQIVGDPDAPGNFAAYFVADDATETLSQTVHLDAGTYTIGFSAYIPRNGFNNSGDATFTGIVAAQPLVTFSVHASSSQVQTWQTWAQTVNIATAGDYLTSFVYQSGPAPAADVVIDDVFIVKGDITPGIPEPATWALMIMGFGGAGAMMRRRRTAAAAA